MACGKALPRAGSSMNKQAALKAAGDGESEPFVSTGEPLSPGESWSAA